MVDHPKHPERLRTPASEPWSTFPDSKMNEHNNTFKPLSQALGALQTRTHHRSLPTIDDSKTNDELGYKPVESFETGIKKTVDWYLNKQGWWLPLVPKI